MSVGVDVAQVARSCHENCIQYAEFKAMLYIYMHQTMKMKQSNNHYQEFYCNNYVYRLFDYLTEFQCAKEAPWRSHSEMSTRFKVMAAVSLASAKLGYSQLKCKQYEAIKAFVNGRDVFVSLPTGGGKSLSQYAVLPFVFDILHERSNPTSLVIVVSPLIALMKDQVETFQYMLCMLAHPTRKRNKGSWQGIFQLIYMSPETLFMH